MNVYLNRKKLRLGLIYGVVAGVAFAIFAWGIDALLLAKANAAYFYDKFIPGLVICAFAGGLAGWLTIVFHRHAIAMLMWGMLAGLCTWLAVWLPFSGHALMIKYLDPSQAVWFSFKPLENLNQFVLLSLLINGLAAIIAGLLEINLVDQAVLSRYISGTVMLIVVCTIILGLAGTAIDNMINTNLREPVQVINSLLQFASDNYGTQVPKATALEMHLSSARQLGDLVLKPRELLLVGYDGSLGMVDILVDFSGTLAKCTTIFSQPINCLILPPNP